MSFLCVSLASSAVARPRLVFIDSGVRSWVLGIPAEVGGPWLVACGPWLVSRPAYYPGARCFADAQHDTQGRGRRTGLDAERTRRGGWFFILLCRFDFCGLIFAFRGGADWAWKTRASIALRCSRMPICCYAHQGRRRLRLPLRRFRAMMTSSRTWKSNMPAQMKSAPLS